METGARNSRFERIRHLLLAWHISAPAHVNPPMPILRLTQNTEFHGVGGSLEDNALNHSASSHILWNQNVGSYHRSTSSARRIQS
jgi:hypothetical protein